jgi:hypothetical protein
MIRLLKKVSQTSLIIKLRNLFNIKPIIVNLKYIEKNHSISDSFIWRTDNGYKTIFSYSDILKNFFNINNTSVSFHFFDNKNNFIKKFNFKNINLSNKIEIDSIFLNGVKGYGTFYIFHNSEEHIKESIRNSCYTGFSKKNSLPSFVHGNIMGAYRNFKQSSNFFTGIVGTSLLQNNIYNIQKSFKKYENVEFFFSNSSNNIMKFKVINVGNFSLKSGESIIVNCSNLEKISIYSNSYFCRPVAFLYKNEYMDVHHC